MSETLVALSVIGTLGVVMVSLALLARRIRRRGSAGPTIGAAMAAYDEAMHSTADEQFLKTEAQRDRRVPIPAPDGVSKHGDHSDMVR